LGPTSVICAKFEHVDPLHRSTRKPSSLVELSAHPTLICELDTGAAVGFDGAAGGASNVVADEVFE
jgi:hypothetical protein